jgi:hypothetical protein
VCLLESPAWPFPIASHSPVMSIWHQKYVARFTHKPSPIGSRSPAMHIWPEKHAAHFTRKPHDRDPHLEQQFAQEAYRGLADTPVLREQAVDHCW